MSDRLTPGKDLIFYSGPSWDSAEIEAGCQALREGGRWVSAGRHVTKFEREFSRAFGHTDSLMVNSGSSANLIMLSALKRHFEWPDESEVIVSVVGFPTTVAPILQTRLKPVFIDIEFDTLNFNLDLIEEKITPWTKAIFLSPVLGNPPDINKLIHICHKHDLKLILDGCDSLGSKWLNRPLSDYVEATSCSFFPSHHISTGEGGMVSSRDTALIRLARKFAWWGRDCYCVGQANASARGTCGNRFAAHLGDDSGIIDHKYLFSEIGFNVKPLDLQGAIGLEQLKKFPGLHAARRRIKARLSESIQRVRPELRIPSEISGAETSWFGVPIICPTAETKQRLIAHLEGAKIQTRHYFAGNLLLHPGYSHLGDANDFPMALEVLRRVFFIGCHPSYSEEVITYIEGQFL